MGGALMAKRPDLGSAGYVLEGEGAFILQRVPATATQRARIRVKVAVHMTDRDVERVRDIVGLGRIIERPRQKPHRKDTFFWQISALAESVKLVTLLRPHIGERRRVQIDNCLAAVESAGGVRDGRSREFKHADVV